MYVFIICRIQNHSQRGGLYHLQGGHMHRHNKWSQVLWTTACFIINFNCLILNKSKYSMVPGTLASFNLWDCIQLGGGGSLTFLWFFARFMLESKMVGESGRRPANFTLYGTCTHHHHWSTDFFTVVTRLNETHAPRCRRNRIITSSPPVVTRRYCTL
jgi:hypothetical protein